MSKLDDLPWSMSEARRFDPVQRTVGFPIDTHAVAGAAAVEADCASPPSNLPLWSRWISARPAWQRRAMAVSIGLIAACLASGMRSQPSEPIGPSGIVAGHILRVPARIDGVVSAVHVQPGDSVEAGQLLVTIDDGQLASQHATMTNVAKFREVRAVRAGQIVSVPVAVGEFVAESETVAEVLDQSSIVAKLYLPEETADQIGATARLPLQTSGGTDLGVFTVERCSAMLVPRPKQLGGRDGSDGLVVEVVARPVEAKTIGRLRVGSVVSLVAPLVQTRAAGGTP